MSAVKRISIQGGSFNADGVDNEPVLNAVIVNAAGISRAYYEGQFNAAAPSPPTCWSSDTYTPAEDVRPENKQATRCINCAHNIRGSGSGGGRACRFSQRVAVALEGDLRNVYQLQVPANSIFGGLRASKMPLQSYVKFLHSRGTRVAGVVTNLYFDTSSDVPRILFKPLRPLEGEEVEIVNEVANHPDTVAATKHLVFVPEAVKQSPFSIEDGFTLNNNGE